MLDEKLAANDSGRAFHDQISLSDDLLPPAALGVGTRGFKHVKARCIFVGGDVQLPIENRAVIEKILAGCDRDKTAAGTGQILEIQLTLAPAFRDVYQQPFAV